jgi:ABC-type uncharacterized transport system permease subunit
VPTPDRFDPSAGAARLGRRLAGGVRSPVTVALVLSFAIAAVILLGSGANPLTAYGEMWTGATSGSGPRTIIDRAIPIIGMALAISIPLRCGIINLGGEGQMVVGGLAAALTAIHMPGPGTIVIITSFVAGALAGGVWALLPALGQTAIQLPILITSLLLNAPARALTSYLVKYYFGDPTATSTTTVALPSHSRLPKLDWLFGGASATVLLIAVMVIAISLFNNRTAAGYQSFISGINLRFARYGGVHITRQTVASMAVGGAIAGMVGAHLVLGQSGRFVDGDLAGSGFAWTGLLVCLLAVSRPVPILVAGAFFAALQVGGLAMQRNAGISGQLAQVLQAVVILALAMRVVPAVRRRRRRRDGTDAVTADDEPLGAVRPGAIETDAGSAAPGIAAR